MRVTMFWHGGANYAAFDTNEKRHAEEFASLRAAVDCFAARADHAPGFPCVESPEAWIIRGPRESALGADYPDYVLTVGPRGGVRIERT